LFNWLYAKRFGGMFLLRIEDTDRERSTQAAVDAILDGLKWLGLDWDGEAISQFQTRRAPSRNRPPSCSLRAAPIAAMRAWKSWSKCARRPASRASRCATTAAGATAIRRRRRPASSR